MTLTNADSPTGQAARRHKEWSLRHAEKTWIVILDFTSFPRDHARLLASRAPYVRDWLSVQPVSALRLVSLRRGGTFSSRDATRYDTMRTAFGPPLLGESR